MHQINLSPEVRARAARGRGGLHVFDGIAAARTALVVVDLQNGFMAPGHVCEIATAREIVPAVNRIGAALRGAGGQVVFLQQTFSQAHLATWSVFFENFSTPERRDELLAAFAPGAEGHLLWPGLEVRAADVLVQKRRFGAFVPGSSDLHAVLQGRGIDTLIITGTATNVCCESTARDAMMMNYKVFFVADANATFGDAEHNATLNAMAHGFCDVVTTAEMLDVIARVPARVAAE
jgi:ureidoacrylate peracid hydrolase